MCVYIFYRKDNIMGSSLIALGQRSVIFILLAGLATGLFGICFFKSIYDGYTFQVTAIVKCSYIITLAAGFFLFHNTPDTFDYIAIALMIVGTVILNLDGTGIYLRFLLQFVRRQRIFWCHLAGYSWIRALLRSGVYL